jgi:hypothetical protein
MIPILGQPSSIASLFYWETDVVRMTVLPQQRGLSHSRRDGRDRAPLLRCGGTEPHGRLIFAASSDRPKDNIVTFSDVLILYTSTQLTVRRRWVVVATQ